MSILGQICMTSYFNGPQCVLFSIESLDLGYRDFSECILATLIQLDNLLGGEGDQGLELLGPQKILGQVAQLQHRLIFFATARDLEPN